jgi:hypothetical protein
MLPIHPFIIKLKSMGDLMVNIPDGLMAEATIK